MEGLDCGTTGYFSIFYGVGIGCLGAETETGAGAEGTGLSTLDIGGGTFGFMASFIGSSLEGLLTGIFSILGDIASGMIYVCFCAITTGGSEALVYVSFWKSYILGKIGDVIFFGDDGAGGLILLGGGGPFGFRAAAFGGTGGVFRGAYNLISTGVSTCDG